MQLDTATHRIHHAALSPEARRFSIEANAKAFNMMLSSIYSDKPRAVLRELAQNAYDAHQEAGIEQPITITLPTTLSPILRVSDAGRGMAHAFMLDGYCSVTHSTKDADSTLVGGLGIGRLAPLSMSESYTVTTTHAGVRTTYMVLLDETRIPSITVLASRPAEGVVGTLIEVPLTQSQLGLFRRETVHKALEYFPAGSLQLRAYEGAVPTVDYTVRTAQFGLRSGHEYYYTTGARLVMGPIAYPIDWSILFADFDYTDPLCNLRHADRLDIFAPIGTVNVAPSREALDYTPQGIRQTLSVLRDAQASIADEVQRDIEAQPYPALRVTRAYQFAQLGVLTSEQVRAEQERLREQLKDAVQPAPERLPDIPEYYAAMQPPLIMRIDSTYRAKVQRRRKQVHAAQQAFVACEAPGTASLFVDLDDVAVQQIQQLTGPDRWHTFADIWAQHGPAQPSTASTTSTYAAPVPRAPRRPTQCTVITVRDMGWSIHSGYSTERRELLLTSVEALATRNDVCWFETSRGTPLLERMIQSDATSEQFAVAQRLLAEYMDVRTMLGVSTADKKALLALQRAGTPHFSTLLERALQRLATDSHTARIVRLANTPKTKDIERIEGLLYPCEFILPALSTRFSDSLFVRTLTMLKSLNVATEHWLHQHEGIVDQLFGAYPNIERPIWCLTTTNNRVSNMATEFFARYPFFDVPQPNYYRYVGLTLPAIEHYLNLIEN